MQVKKLVKRHMIQRFICLALLLGTFAFPAFAAETKVTAIAMHGAPKYAKGAKALDYVNANAPKGGTLVQSVAGTFDTLNPFNIKGKPAQGLDYVYDRLAARVWDEPFTLYGLIAKEMIVPDDRSSITFILDPSAKFQDKTSITADDVKFSYETLKQYGRPNMRRVYQLVSKVTIKGPREIRFDLGPGYDRETVMILAMMPILPAHDWQGREFNATTLQVPVGSGPYRIKNVGVGRKIEYERVKDDWAANHITRVGLNNFDRLIFDYYRDDAVALEAFKAHDVDVRREFDTAKWQTAYKDVSPKVTMQALPHGRPEWVKGFIFNMRRDPFKDIRVRQALNFAFDADFVNQTLYRGEGKRIVSTFPNTELSALADKAEPKEKVKENPRDNLVKADTLLREAGWTVSNGVRAHIQDARPMNFQILLSSPQDEKIALALTNNLKKLGINATVRTVDAAQFAGALAAYDYDMVLYYWINSLSPGSEQMIYWSCDAAKTQGSKNYSGICNKDVDKAASAIAAAHTRPELVNAARALDARIMDANVFIPLFTIGKDYWAFWDNIRHPAVNPLYGQVIETWWGN